MPLAVITQGGKRLALGDRFYDYGVGQYLVASVDVPVTGHVLGAAAGRPALGFGMTLEPAVIAELLLQAGPGDLPRSAGNARPGIAVSDAPRELLEAIVRLLRLLDRPQDRKVMVPLVKREILWMLMTGSRATASASSELIDVREGRRARRQLHRPHLVNQHRTRGRIDAEQRSFGADPAVEISDFGSAPLQYVLKEGGAVASPRRQSTHSADTYCSGPGSAISMKCSGSSRPPACCRHFAALG